MHCMLCQSSSLSEYSAEMIVHFSGLRNVNNPGITVCRKVVVCLVCGFSRFMTPEPELTLLADDTRNSGLAFRHGVATCHPRSQECA